jgi:hypothetical protein
MRRKRWSELSGRQRTAIIVAGVLQASLSVATLVDLRRRPSTQIPGKQAAVDGGRVRELRRAARLLLRRPPSLSSG